MARYVLERGREHFHEDCIQALDEGELTEACDSCYDSWVGLTARRLA